jgi:transposase
LQLRQDVVRAVRNGQSLRVVPVRFGVSVSFVRRWKERAGTRRLDRVDWSDHRTTRNKTHNRTPLEVERSILQMRTDIEEQSALGEYGAVAIHTNNPS